MTTFSVGPPACWNSTSRSSPVGRPVMPKVPSGLSVGTADTVCPVASACTEIVAPVSG